MPLRNEGGKLVRIHDAEILQIEAWGAHGLRVWATQRGGGLTSYTLTFIKAGTCSGSVVAGSSLTLIASAASGSTFARRSGACRAASAPFDINNIGGTCTAVSVGQIGSFKNARPTCYNVSAIRNGWGCSNRDGRTVSVNGAAAPSPQAGSYSCASLY